MTNPDINTLNGSLEQLGITMADNLVTMGVSDADPSDGLTTLAGKILQISPIPVPASISLTADKSILSYTDSQSATLSATVLDSNDDPVEGATVEFFNGGTSMGTASTNSSGVATKSYASTGAGDISFTAGIGSLVSETFVVRDTIKYIPSELTSSQTLSVPNPPTNFKCSFKVSDVANSGKSSYLQIGSDTNNCLCIGNSGGRTLAILVRVSGSYATMQYQENVLQTGTDNLIEYSYEDGSQTIKCNGTTVTLSNTQITARNYVGSYINNSNMKEIIFELL